MSDRVTTVAFRGKVENRDAVAPLLSASGDVAVVERGKPRLLVMRCPCGCGDDLLVNLDNRAGPAWRYYLNRFGLTLFPSYWRDSACGSHFIVWNSHIYWCMGWETAESETWMVSKSIEEAVLAALPADRFIKYDDLAYQLDLIPWEVLQACRQLVKRGVVIGNVRPRSGEFRKTEASSGIGD